MTDKPRTSQQNRAMHKWFRLCSEALNDAGLDMKKTLKPTVDIPWDDEGRMFKEHIWRPVMEAMTGEESTTDMDTVEPSQVYEVITRHMAESHAIALPAWPDRFNAGG